MTEDRKRLLNNAPGMLEASITPPSHKGFDNMKFRKLGQTGIELPVLSFGASSLGQEFRQVDIERALRSVHVALDEGMNFIDTSPYYGPGCPKCCWAWRLRDIPRDQYFLGTKLGRYDAQHFDFSARRVEESVDSQPAADGRGASGHCALPRYRVRRHEPDRRRDVAGPAAKLQRQGKVRFVGVSGYPMNMFRYVLDRTDLDRRLVVQPLHAPEHHAGRPGPYLQDRRESAL